MEIGSQIKQAANQEEGDVQIKEDNTSNNNEKESNCAPALPL